MEDMKVKKESSFKGNFGFRGWLIIIFFGFMLFLNSSFTADGMNIMVPTLAEKNGWDPNLMLSYNGIAGWISVIGAFILSSLVTKFKAKRVILVSLAIVGLSFISLAIFTNFITWVIAVILINTFANGMSFCGCGVLIAKWFPKKKGLVMGYSTMGNNLGSAIFIPIFALCMSGGNVQLPFIAYFIFIVIMFIFGAIIIKNRPEELGIAPDNEPMSVEELKVSLEEEKNYKSPWTMGKLLKDKEIWLMGIGYGLLFMATVGMVMQFVPRVTGLGFESNMAITMLSIAAVIGIVASYFWGVIDQKFGTKFASKVLALWFIIAIILNILPGNWTLYLSVVMLGCALGGNSNFTTSMCATIFGRHNFERAFNIVFPITTVFRAGASIVLGTTLALSGNNFTVAYSVFLVASILAFIIFALINDTPKAE